MKNVIFWYIQGIWCTKMHALAFKSEQQFSTQPILNKSIEKRQEEFKHISSHHII